MRVFTRNIWFVSCQQSSRNSVTASVMSRNCHVSVFTAILAIDIGRYLSSLANAAQGGKKTRKKRDSTHGRIPSGIGNPRRRRMMRQNMSKKCQNARRAGEEGGIADRIADDPSRKCGPAFFVGDWDFSENVISAFIGTRFFILPFSCVLLNIWKKSQFRGLISTGWVDKKYCFLSL